ncbi:hypothetical protein DNU06_15365 [Putridiphycobacter roseus]|uniref:histidine kinase n=1 Tax=Putridiphycobacter roseus TaxID=2219161 RepID=A0A2W1N9S8_9FLAO|nr:sensor histidine kinase [Putridiphycobacter roseus]PZE16025.1 hypothetical protein DNU06_15365 [Putridiphycobacter roseus]
MLNILKLPKINFKDFHSQSMFILSYRIVALTSIFFSILSIVHFKSRSLTFWVCITVLLLSLAGIWYMRKYGKHFIIAKVIIFISTILIQINIYNLLNPDRYMDMIWILIIVLYSFYAIGLVWGVTTLLINFLGILFYQFFVVSPDLKPFNTYSSAQQVDYVLTVVFGGIMICYLLILFYKTQNITNLKYRAANEKLRVNNKVMLEQNKEKSVMLKEIHHRVKNNLQVITSLLRLQSKDIEDPEVIKQFNEATNRVIAMSLIHEKIYQTEDLSNIDLSAYIKSLTDELIRSYSVNIPVQTEIKANLNFITPDYMVPFALLINELTSNSLKHGFKDKSSGEIRISIFEDNNTIAFDYHDNGTWDIKAEKVSFGIELIETLTEQLEGTYTRTTENGTKYSFVFPINI